MTYVSKLTITGIIGFFYRIILKACYQVQLLIKS